MGNMIKHIEIIIKVSSKHGKLPAQHPFFISFLFVFRVKGTSDGFSLYSSLFPPFPNQTTGRIPGEGAAILEVEGEQFMFKVMTREKRMTLGLYGIVK